MMCPVDAAIADLQSDVFISLEVLTLKVLLHFVEPVEA
jgi:hypothetical protein